MLTKTAIQQQNRAFRTTSYAGVFVGEATGTFTAIVRLQTLFATGSGAIIGSSGADRVGGGSFNVPVFTSSYSTVKVDAGGGDDIAGGIVGDISLGSFSISHIAALYATGTVRWCG